MKNLIVTRHLQTGPDEALPGLMRVAACQPGVLGQTGIESLELVKCAMQTAQPDVVIVIDALAAAEPGRLFRTVQLSDSGIVPGSGVGNSRQEFSRADAGRAGHRRGRADGRGRDLPVPAGGAGAGRAAGRAGHDAGCGHTGARDGQARRLQLRSGAAPGIVAG